MFFSKVLAVFAVAVAVSVSASPVPLPFQVARREEQVVRAVEVLPVVHRRAIENTVPVEAAAMAPNGVVVPFQSSGAKREVAQQPEVLEKRDVPVQNASMNKGQGIQPFVNTGKRSVEAEPELVARAFNAPRINTFPSHVASRSDGDGIIVAF